MKITKGAVSKPKKDQRKTWTHELVPAPGPGGQGWQLELVPEDDDDIYTISAILRPGDAITGNTIRNHAIDKYHESQRIHLWLTGIVEAISYTPTDSSLRVKTRVNRPNEYISIGTYHTFTIQQNAAIGLWKPEPFDSFDIELLEEAISNDRTSNLRAIIMQEDIAHIAVVSPFRTILKARITSKHRGKRQAILLAKQRKGTRLTDSFFSDIISMMTLVFPNIASSPILVASPGFTATDFRQFCVRFALNSDDKYLKTAAKNMIIAHSSTGHLHGLNEALRNGAIGDNIFSEHERLINDFKKRVLIGDERAVYHPSVVRKAFEMGAITGGSQVFIGTNFFFERDPQKRKETTKLVQGMRDAGANVYFMPANQENGDSLYLWGGMAAIMSFPVPGLGDGEFEEDEEWTPPAPYMENPVEGLIV